MVSITRWNRAQAPSEPELRTWMQQETLRPYSWSNNPGEVYQPHSHSYDKVICVVAGSITWILPETGEEIETQLGDRLDLPRGVVRAARVGSQGVTCLDAHR